MVRDNLIAQLNLMLRDASVRNMIQNWGKADLVGSQGFELHWTYATALQHDRKQFFGLAPH